MVQRPGSNRGRLQDRVPQAKGQDQPPFSGGNRGVPAGQALHAGVLLRLSGLPPRQARLRAYPDGHGQHVLRPGVQQAGGGHQAGASEGFRAGEEGVAVVGQVEQPGARSVQA